MKEIQDGIEIYNLSGKKAGVIIFNEGTMYIAISLTASPITIKNVANDTIQQIGDFFSFRKNPEVSAFRIDFPELSIRIDGTTIYFIQKITLMLENIGIMEMRKIGTYLKKKSKNG